jgi:hypothetical protein
MICIIINFDSNFTNRMVICTHVIHHKDISLHLKQKHENFKATCVDSAPCISHLYKNLNVLEKGSRVKS